MISVAVVASTNRRMRYTIGAQALLATALVMGCNAKNSSDDEKIRQQAAQTTTEVKQGAKQAGDQIKEGAAKAEPPPVDVAAGVKDGLKTPTGDASTEAVDINSATAGKLTTLPGVGAAE